MSLAPWRSPLSRALHLNRSQAHSRYFQLATVKKEGFPANRTVVFRGFLEDSDRLKIITDSRSDKIEDIQNRPWGEICWYFTQTREQFRIFGNLIVVTKDCTDRALKQARQETWQNLSDTARQQFTWFHPKQTKTENKESFIATQPSKEEPLDNFYLLLLEPQRVDHLELKGEPQNRSLYVREDSQTWSMRSVNP
jgi:pyridoxamine 5'-phosphate oxidase